MKYYSADLIYTNLGTPLTGSAIITDDDGLILDISDKSRISADILHINGAIVPGFVNAHCHLELSHLKGKLDTGTGLIPFIRSVVTMRDFPESEIFNAIKAADKEMTREGIVAVGDISNTLHTSQCKDQSEINYYTFVEMFDFLKEDEADKSFKQYYEVFNKQSDQNGNQKSCVPHAPYSVSNRLFEKINQVNGSFGLVSLHNQETVHEDNFFLKKEGKLLDFFDSFGIDMSEFNATGKTSIHYAMEHMDPLMAALFVHNTMSTEKDISAAHEWNSKCYWVTCPNANLYIENRLPDYRQFINQDAKMAIGTDSLSSNWQLSILEEMKTIQRFQSYLDTETLIRWSSYHSAKAMGYDLLGSIEKSKKPGLIALEAHVENNEIRLSDVIKHYRLI